MQNLNDLIGVDDPKHIYHRIEELDELNVGNKVYKFRLVSNLKDGDKDLDGVTHLDRMEIHLDSSILNLNAVETIIHEILHCILDNVGLDESNYDGVTIPTTNEYLANVLAKQLLLLFRLNPKLINILNDCISGTDEA